MNAAKITVPRLRFTQPDGTPFPDWEEKRLGDVADIMGGGTPESGNAEFWGGDINWFTPTEIKTKYLKTSVRKLTQTGLKKSSAKLLPVGTLLLSTRATIGDVGIATAECTTNQGFQSLTVFDGESNEFWYYWISHNKTEFIKRSNGSTFNEIGKASVKSIIALRPHPDEQAKIAEVLSDADALITSLEKLITKKKAIKQGIMQQLLTGKKRLVKKGTHHTKQSEVGVIPEDWSVARIEELVSISTGSKNTEDNKPDGQYPFFIRSQELEKIDTFSYDKEAVLTAGDGGTGKIFHYIYGKFDAHQRVYIMSDFRNQIFGKYFYWQFSTLFFNRIMSMTAKSTVDSVRREMIADMLLPLPPVKEQKAIAEALSDADEEINQAYEKLHKTKKIKAGMMQELLTGRMRLI